MKRAASHLTIVLLVVLATAGMVLQAASVPHLHAAHGGPGLYNADHDLLLLASLAGQVTLSDAAPTVAVDPGLPSRPVSGPDRLARRVAHADAPRAPPVR